MSTFTMFLLGVLIVIALLLILIVMVQKPKGGGLSASFAGNTQVVGGVQNTTDFLDKSTWVLSGLLIGGILLVNLYLKSAEAPQAKSILEDVKTELPAPIK